MNSKVYNCTLYLKHGSTVQTETTDPDAFIASLNNLMDAFYRRRLFRRVNSTVRLIGTPTTCIPIDNILCYTVQERIT